MRHDASGHPDEASLHRVAEDGIETAGPEVRAHLDGCGRCRRELEGIRRVLRAAGELPGGIAPRRDLWPEVEARVRSGGPAAGGGDAGRRPGGARSAAAERWGLRTAAPWLAAAAAVLVAVTAGTTLWLADGGSEAGPRTAATSAGGPGAAGPSPAGPAGAMPAAVLDVRQGYRPMVDRLAAVLDRRGERLPPATRRVVERNLEIIDAAIAETEAALAGSPSSPELVRMLDRAYQRKVELLRRSARLAARM